MLTIAEFRYPNAMYILSANDFKGTEEQYMSMMNSVRASLSKLAEASYSNTLDRNLLIWSSWLYAYRNIVDGNKSEGIVIFQMSGNPVYIFDNKVQYKLNIHTLFYFVFY